MDINDEPKVMVAFYDDGTENKPFEKNRIFRGAFAFTDSQNDLFDGFIYEGFVDEDTAKLLGSYDWQQFFEFEGRTLWRNLSKEMVELTAEVFGLDIEFPKYSLNYRIDNNY